MWRQINLHGPLIKGFACMDFNLQVRPQVAGCLLLPAPPASLSSLKTWQEKNETKPLKVP